MRIITGISIVGTMLLFCFGPFDPYDPAPKHSGDNDTATTPIPQRPSGLLGWWTCNDSSNTTLKDSLGKSDGQITECTRVSGKSGLAISLNGKSSYVLIPSTSDSLFDFGTGDFTLSAWVKPQIIEVETDSMNYGIITKGVARDRGYGLYIEKNHFSAFVGQYNPGSTDTVMANANTWRHCVMLRRKGTVELYIDGKKNQSYDNDDNVTTSINLLIGQDASSEQENNFPGLIDEIKILNTAWSASDITNEYRRFSD